MYGWISMNLLKRDTWNFLKICQHTGTKCSVWSSSKVVFRSNKVNWTT